MKMKGSMFLHINSVRYLKGYRLEVQFSDGVVKEVDLEEELYGSVFEPLKSEEAFRQVYLDEETRTIAWPGGADFAPEFLYEKGKTIRQAA